MVNTMKIKAGSHSTLIRGRARKSRRGFITAAGLTFAHTIGEFGVVLMVGGNIPGETRVVSIAIYDHVETLEYAQAHQLSVVLLVFAFTAIFLMYVINQRMKIRL